MRLPRLPTWSFASPHVTALCGAAAALLLTAALGAAPAPAGIIRVWLTHRSQDAAKIVVNWETAVPGNSVVRFGPTPAYGQEAHADEAVTLHHVEIAVPRGAAACHYQVESGGARSAPASFKTYAADQLRVAVAADWLRKPGLESVLKDDPHLVLTAGDHVPNLWESCGPGVRDCTKPFGQLVDTYADLFRSTPFMPVLGNHDREIRPRGPQPPPEPVYDVDATAFRSFFELPDDEWKWSFDVPEFGVRFIALDFNHTQDIGTTWQTCHPLQKGSEQHEWYRALIERTRSPFVVTVHNEKHSNIRARDMGEWHRLMSRGTLAISGFGYYAERAEVDGFSYYNTSLSKGDQYPDPQSRFLAGEDSYLLLTFEKNPRQLRAQLKRREDGQVLHQMAHAPR